MMRKWILNKLKVYAGVITGLRKQYGTNHRREWRDTFYGGERVHRRECNWAHHESVWNGTFYSSARGRFNSLGDNLIESYAWYLR